MASNVIDIGSRRRKAFRRNNRLADLIFCPFTLVPGAGGRVLLWWSEERTWIAAFPSLQAAHDFILGKEEGWPRNPGYEHQCQKRALRAARKEREISAVRVRGELERLRSLHPPWPWS
jgi:hypothetical protein